MARPYVLLKQIGQQPMLLAKDWRGQGGRFSVFSYFTVVLFEFPLSGRCC